MMLVRVGLVGLLDEANLALRRLSAHAVFASIDALEDGPPLKVHQCDEHERETKANGNVQGPLDSLLIFNLVSKLLVLDDKGGSRIGRVFGLLARIGLAASDDPDLVSAIEGIVAAVRDDFLYSFGLRLPEVRVERANDVHFTAFGDLFNRDLELHRLHLRPDVRPARDVSLLVLQFDHAWALRVFDP